MSPPILETSAEVSVSAVSVLEGSEKAELPVVATVFDKLNQVYKEYLEAEQSYAAVRAETGTLRAKRQHLAHEADLSVSAGRGVGPQSRCRHPETAGQDSGGH